MQLIAALLLAPWLPLLSHGSDGLVPLSVLAGAAAIAMVVASTLVGDVIRRLAPLTAPHRCSAALDRRARLVAVVPQRDPDARGRTRPRAPAFCRRQRAAGDVFALGSVPAGA